MRSLRRIVDFVRTYAPTRHTGALLVFGAIFCVLLVPKLVPTEPGRVLSNSPADASILVWSLAWWPHAIAHGHLLPYSYDVFAPGGTNLAWTTSIPTAGVLLAPLTNAFGPFVSFDVLAMLAPVTAAWTTYLLVDRITGRWLPSVAAGLLFAISPLETDQVAVGHLNLGLAALVPLAAYLVIRRLEGSLSALAFVTALGVTVAAQLGLSTEVLATGTLFGVLAMALLYAWDRARRPVLLRCAGLIACSYGIAGAIGSPLLYAAFALPHPSGVVGTASSTTPFSGIETHLRADPGAIAIAVGIGVPLFLAFVWLVWTAHGRPVARALATTAIVALICSVGILVVGSTTVPTPWTALRHVPFLHLVRPQRLTMFAWLIAAAGAGIWSARSRSPRTWAVVVAAMAALLPAVFLGRWTSQIPPRPGLLASLPSEATLAVVAASPRRSDQYTDLAVPMVWQADSQFSFRLANAYVGSFPPELPLAVRRFEFGRASNGAGDATVRAWMRRSGVDAVLVVRRSAAALRQDVP